MGIIKNTADDPRIPKIRALLKKNPKATISTIRYAFRIGDPTIRRWVKEGLIPMPYITPKNKMGPKWRRDGAAWLNPKKYKRDQLTQQDRRIDNEREQA